MYNCPVLEWLPTEVWVHKDVEDGTLTVRPWHWCYLAGIEHSEIKKPLKIRFFYFDVIRYFKSFITVSYIVVIVSYFKYLPTSYTEQYFYPNTSHVTSVVPHLLDYIS